MGRLSLSSASLRSDCRSLRNSRLGPVGVRPGPDLGLLALGVALVPSSAMMTSLRPIIARASIRT